jgi:HPt (histidine-containing phosphotransfer) domain-containing protein
MIHEHIIVQISSELKALIPKYLDNRRKDIEKVEMLLLEDNMESLRILGHTLKGSGTSYGFTGITALGERIEIAAKEGNKRNIDEARKELQQYIDTVQIVFIESL